MQHIDKQKQAILSCIRKPEAPERFVTLEAPFTREHIQEMLDTVKTLSIPDTGTPILLDRPLVMHSGCHLRVEGKQMFLQAPDSDYCLIRNEHVQDGANGATDPSMRDNNISVSGGYWHIRRGVRSYTDENMRFKGSLGAVIFCSVERISLSDMVICDSPLCGAPGNGSCSYGIQLCDCRDFIVENIDFVDNHRDGVHVNGPATYGLIRHIRGEKMGDDTVALNAWDWCTSALTFGNIEHVVVEDTVCCGNEFRLLPGQKIYPDGSRTDCDIRDIVLENVSGIYTFKLYEQPNIANVGSTLNDVSGTVGTIENVSFRHVKFDVPTSSGLNDLPVDGMFDVCSDLTGLYIEDICVPMAIGECLKKGMRLVSVGPLSATWKQYSPNDPAGWGEVFDPDAICHATEIYMENIFFDGEKITDPEKLVRTVRMKVNTDYPHTTPKGGTGYGTLGTVTVK